ncbi:mitochondrial ribosomal protein subunit L20-domain-containing protein [Xylariomycetidae sp. FL2044]|nr:mitochondrial ribosomal protein subunit L20-domain-containing protein [Xylariomycetidae sp. FL2044]
MMETRQLINPLKSLVLKSCTQNTSRTAAAAKAAAATTSIFNTTTTTTVTTVQRRHQSSTARTKRALKIAPHPSFLTSPEDKTHIIYNPPSAAPSVYHTPFKFLPKSDPRRQANLTQLFRTSADQSPSSSSAAAGGLPPLATAKDGLSVKYSVTREQVDEMRALRAEDPDKWSVVRLADKYGCTPYFVLMCCKANREHQARERERLAAIKARWGPIRTQAREERRKRKALLMKGQI